MKRHYIFVILSLVIALFFTQTACALPAKTQWLASQGIISGRKTANGIDYALDNPLRRDEATKLLVTYAGEGGRAQARQLSAPSFSDIAVTNWAAGYADVAKAMGIIKGYPDGSFLPGKSVSYAELASMLVRMDNRWKLAPAQTIIWPGTYLERAAQYGILNDIRFTNASEAISRQDAFAMLYNAIHAQSYEIYVTFDDQSPLAPQQTTFDVNLGSSLGSRFPLNPAATETGEEFLGWNTSSDGKGAWVNQNTTFNASQTVYGIWQIQGVSIRYVEHPAPITIGRSDTITADEIGLPQYITLYLSDRRPMTIAVIWDRSSLDVSTPGHYLLPGSYEVPPQVSGGPVPPVNLSVTVK